MSFFKRAFSAAMQRREDLREEAFEKFDKDVNEMQKDKNSNNVLKKVEA